MSVNGIAIFLLEAQDAAWLGSYQWNIRARFITSLIGESAVGAAAAGGNDGDAQMDRRAIAHGHARPLDASAALARPEEAAEKASECKICQYH